MVPFQEDLSLDDIKYPMNYEKIVSKKTHFISKSKVPISIIVHPMMGAKSVLIKSNQKRKFRLEKHDVLRKTIAGQSVSPILLPRIEDQEESTEIGQWSARKKVPR